MFQVLLYTRYSPTLGKNLLEYWYSDRIEKDNWFIW